ncbi:nitroreductase family protein [Pseudonocardia asaccharolytica]|uniref:Putative NAD(P)H nitroreductase n=1 Tax=Pseudonocardia asaccharolytica DSM 44247 = NBRC 16224 TaxID=1123024 RepID=A0A511D388_9PSEU|nr:nitroreductase [Pseudonocardia asaccharolytica]GEL18983.1 nitroreductase [Pseudonocardia asaccharolytica DSM 44247 = NBRC 16224]
MTRPEPRAEPGSGSDPLAPLRDRRSCPALTAPAPSADDLHALLTAACSAPDHGRLRPWRFIVIDTAALGPLGDAFAAGLAERDPGAGPDALDRIRAKAQRAPMIVVVVSSPVGHPTIPAWEQQASAACVAYGLVLAADALGYGAMWRTGWFGEAPKVRAHLGLADHEDVTGWIYLGTPAGSARPPRSPHDVPVSRLS